MSIGGGRARRAAFIAIALLGGGGLFVSVAGQGATELKSVNLVEVARLGGFEASGVRAFGMVRSATLIPGGDHFAVVDGSTQEIHYFTRSGDHVRTAGRRGNGPGEFQALAHVRGRPDGGLCAWDIQQARVTELDSAGSVVSTATANLDDVRRIRPDFVGFLADCSFVLRDRRETMEMRDEPEGIRRDPTRFIHFSPQGQPLREVARRADVEKWFYNRDGGWGYRDLIFGDQLVGFVSGEALWVGESSAFQWTRTGIVSGTSDSLRLVTNTRSASREDVEAERARQHEGILERVEGRLRRAAALGVDGAAPRMTERETESIDQVPARGELPAYDRAVAGIDGSVWLRVYPRPGAREVRWMMVTSDGDADVRVVLPRDTQLLSASGDSMILLEVDELDAPVVRVIRLEPAPPDSGRYP